jgi:hypothetical protein
MSKQRRAELLTHPGARLVAARVHYHQQQAPASYIGTRYPDEGEHITLASGEVLPNEAAFYVRYPRAELLLIEYLAPGETGA